MGKRRSQARWGRPMRRVPWVRGSDVRLVYEARSDVLTDRSIHPTSRSTVSIGEPHLLLSPSVTRRGRAKTLRFLPFSLPPSSTDPGPPSPAFLPLSPGFEPRTSPPPTSSGGSDPFPLPPGRASHVGRRVEGRPAGTSEAVGDASHRCAWHVQRCKRTQACERAS